MLGCDFVLIDKGVSLKQTSATSCWCGAVQETFCSPCLLWSSALNSSAHISKCLSGRAPWVGDELARQQNYEPWLLRCSAVCRSLRCFLVLGVPRCCVQARFGRWASFGFTVSNSVLQTQLQHASLHWGGTKRQKHPLPVFYISVQWTRIID